MEKSERIASFLLKSLRKANRAYGLIEEGDRIAIGVSGGKDSQALLRLLAKWQPSAPIHYDLIAVHIDASEIWDGAVEQRAKVKALFQDLQIEHTIRPIELAPDEPRPLSCFRCSWNRRRHLFTTAQELGCNKVALGHHADDIATTTLMNLLFHGRLESMAPKCEMFDGLITLIRPLALIEERDIVYLARSAGFFHKDPCCPNGAGSKRVEVQALLRQAKKVTPQAQRNLYRAVERASCWADER
jgi:tRNA 2-thiocytidine biosynthesis protein TtcA